MKKSTIEIIITSVLIIILIFSVSNIFKSRKKRLAKKRPAEIATVKQKKPEVSAALAKVTYEDLEERVKELEWGRNPFVYKPTYSVGAQGDLILDGIVWDKQNPKAMINELIVGVGEKIGKYTVIGITPDSVILTDGIDRIRLKF